ncbi:maleylpyruvate isomerase family mycothiol-dependent enzyme [Mycolicibacterium celeriflavum]|uniref:Mycothiol-dependent maleylpyruvate isomerase metal-binding domain-containing protein n=1 Tax=Mycolicibacterium celeriflavum TaxID=1249101 RepID=A0A7I7RID8_MYCCF|nr:maleylpyruvate isomerase family mycothiol-dependent enzyme [Mycolicibacterium celeriflavum]BBY44050.1 hypothetical protein MCEL_23450 [Mycolicibacterium celeriflavum]
MSLGSAAGLPDMPNDVWPLVHAERRALIADLETLDEAQWVQPSLCDGWSVHDVAAHMVDVATTTRLGFVAAMAKARFDFDRQNAHGIERARGASPQQTLQRLREAAARTSTPPAPLDTRIVEEVLHGEDIRRPLGFTREYPMEAVVRALRHQARMSASFGGAKDLVKRIRIVATDADVALGSGSQVRGPALALLLAISGRRVALDELDGPGVAEWWVAPR